MLSYSTTSKWPNDSNSYKLKCLALFYVLHAFFPDPHNHTMFRYYLCSVDEEAPRRWVSCSDPLFIRDMQLGFKPRAASFPKSLLLEFLDLSLFNPEKWPKGRRRVRQEKQYLDKSQSECHPCTMECSICQEWVRCKFLPGHRCPLKMALVNWSHSLRAAQP